MGNHVHRALSIFGDKSLLKVEVFKWSSEEFIEEHAIIYTSISDDKRICVVRASANPEKARLTIHDKLCVDEGVSMAVEAVAERDINTGEYYLGHHKVECSEGIKQPTHSFWDPFKYGSPHMDLFRHGSLYLDPFLGRPGPRGAVIYVLKVESFKGLNYSAELLRMHHSLSFLIHWPVLTVEFKCHKNKGLEVETDLQLCDLHIDRTVKGNPEDYVKNYSIVRSE
ncbi:hypothetical protein L6164_000602 [Bauhinia variegata]|uniref:Uncharacterized protein n=1 Tax=Bauhinia variegata TaxID=167791 RepID=A0ACB9Q6J1_BAUVA|nr:hypothetical protein L6164_000602 [Bauhinia variegata]